MPRPSPAAPRGGGGGKGSDAAPASIAASAAIAAVAATEDVVPAAAGGASAVELTESNFDELMSEGPWMVDVYANWCSHCRQLEPVWENLAKELAPLGIRVGKINGPENRALMNRFGVDRFPSIYLLRDGAMWAYDGSLNLAAFKEYAVRGYSKDSALPFWKAPNSAAGRALGYVHRLPSLLKAGYGYLKDELGYSDLAIVLGFLAVPVIVGGGSIFLLDMLYLRGARAAADEAHYHVE